MVVELADEVVAAVDGGPAEEGVGLELHGALAFDDAVALVAGFGWSGRGRRQEAVLFLDLEEERVAGPLPSR